MWPCHTIVDWFEFGATASLAFVIESNVTLGKVYASYHNMHSWTFTSQSCSLYACWFNWAIDHYALRQHFRPSNMNYIAYYSDDVCQVIILSQPTLSWCSIHAFANSIFLRLYRSDVVADSNTTAINIPIDAGIVGSVGLLRGAFTT